MNMLTKILGKTIVLIVGFLAMYLFFVNEAIDFIWDKLVKRHKKDES